MRHNHDAAHSGPPMTLKWGAIFGGTVVALGVWILLYVFGLAAGLSAMDPNDPGSARAAGIGTGIWSLVAPLIALFVGGMVAGRTAGLVTRGGGIAHGAVLWGLTMLIGLWGLGNLIQGLAGGVKAVGSTATQAISAGASAGAQGGGSMLQSLGLNANDFLAPINQRLQAEGKPPITAQGLEAAVRDAANTAVRQGRFDRELFVSSVAQNTNLSRQDAEQVANRLETQLQQGQGQLAQMGQNVQQGALQVADTTGKIFWGVFAALLLGLVSAVLGAGVGVTRRQDIETKVGAPLRPEVTPTTRTDLPHTTREVRNT